MKSQENDFGEFLDDTQPEFAKGDIGASETCKVGHEWVVFGTALRDVCLMVQCVNCGAMGTVDDPDKREWSEAFHAPSEPYGWDDDSRVTIRGRGPLYVEKIGNQAAGVSMFQQTEGRVA